MSDDSEALRLWLQADTRGGSGGAEGVTASLRVPGLTVLAHPEFSRVGEVALLAGVAAGRTEVVSRVEPGFAAPGTGRVRPLADPFLSRRPLRFSAGPEPGSIRVDCREAGSELTAGGAPVGGERLFSAAEVERGVVLLLGRRVALVLGLLLPAVEDDLPSYGMVGESVPMRQVRREIRRVAPLGVPVLLRGETGTGKELAALALHQAGARRGRPFLAANLGALTPSLAAAELFGVMRGAYTGAERSREGYFQRADGGTLFLDEVGEAPPEVQVMLLRALETQEIQAVGGEVMRRVDVRLIAATDADLDRALQAGDLRAPFLHRLAACALRLPPVRERRDDFGRLFFHFLREVLSGWGEVDRLATVLDGRPWIPAGLVARLAELSWPGNVRQLRNVVHQVALAGRDAGEGGMWLAVEAQCAEAGGSAAAAAPTATAPTASAPTARTPSLPVQAAPTDGRTRSRQPEDITDDELLAALRRGRFNIQRAASQLGISRGSVYQRIERCPRLRKAADLTREEIQACRERCGGNLDAMVAMLEVSRRGLQRWMTRLGMD